MEAPKISRLELLRLNRRLVLVRKGLSILTRKRDAMLAELVGMEEEAARLGRALDDILGEAERARALARAAEGGPALESAAAAAEAQVTFDAGVRNVWGVRLNRAEHIKARRGPLARGSAPGLRSPLVDETMDRYERTLETLVQTALAVSRRDNVKTAATSATRRVNSLEQRLFPEIQAGIQLIRARLEELAREELFRLKRFKAIAQRRGGPV